MPRWFTANSWQRTLYIMFFAQFGSIMGFFMIFPFFPLYVQNGVMIWFGFSGAFVVTGLFFIGTAAIAVRWLPDYKPIVQPQAV